MPGRGVARGLQLEHLGRQVGDRLLRPLPSAAPTPCRRCGPASAGALLPPTYFCTSSIFDAGHVDLRAAVELELQVLFGLAVLLQQLQPAIAADAVRQVDDVVAFAQLEKAVDRAAQPAPRGPVQVRRDETVRCR